MRKKCSRCGSSRKLKYFGIDPRYRMGVTGWCKRCKIENGRSPEKKQKNKNRWKKYIAVPENREYERKRSLIKYHRDPRKIRDQVLKRKLGISLKKFERTKKCVLCKQKGRLVADHNHESGNYRGAICHMCNLMVAWFEKIPNLGIKVTDYLRRG